MTAQVRFLGGGVWHLNESIMKAWFVGLQTQKLKPEYDKAPMA